jgi:para-nitrobenzyl esterase
VQYGRIYGPGTNNRFDATIGTTLNTAVGKEDCLYLNIWRPATHAAGMPVIVFVHGGSDVSGYTADPVYDGAALARTANAVVVTVNYRLGIFGFLDQPFLKTGGADPATDSGNFGLLDIVKALEFVQHDIARFGGNPQNVTLMGQSAGAINVWALMASQLVVQHQPQLFHRAVPLSGGMSLAANLPVGSIPTLNPEPVYLLQGNTLLRKQLITDGLATDDASADAWIAANGSQAAQYLRSRRPDSLLFTLLFRMAALGLAGSGPIPEGTILPTNPVEAVRAGQYLRVPVLAGNVRDEAKLFPTFLTLFGLPSGRLVTDAELFSTQFHTNPEAAATTTLEHWIPATYLPVTTPVTGFNARTDLLNRVFFIASRDNILGALSSQQSNVWYYRFDWDEEPAPWNDIYGAAHLFDLPFLFGTFGPSLFGNVAFTNANAPGRLALSSAMMTSLANFARQGDPNAPGALGVNWPTWPATLIFDATPTQKAISVQ